MVLVQYLAVVAGGHHSVHLVFRRCAAPEKKRAVRTGGNNSLQRVETGAVKGEKILGRFGLTGSGKENRIYEIAMRGNFFVVGSLW